MSDPLLFCDPSAGGTLHNPAPSHEANEPVFGSAPYRTSVPPELRSSDQSKLDTVRETVQDRPWASVGIAALTGFTSALVALRPKKVQRTAGDNFDVFEGASCPLHVSQVSAPENAIASSNEHEPQDPDEVHAEAVKEHLEENEPSWISELAMSAFSATLASFTASKGNAKQNTGLWSAMSKGRSAESTAQSSAAKPQATARRHNASNVPGPQSKFPRPKHDRSRTAPKSPWRLIKTTVSDFIEDKAPRLAAALAYYTVFSIAPLLLITVSVLAVFVGGEESATTQIRDRVEPVLGQAATDAVLAMLQGANKAGGGLIATLIGIGVLIFGASGVFAQMKDALDTIWEVEPKPGRGILATVKDRALSFLLVLIIGLLLLSSMFVSTAINFMSEHASDVLPIPSTVIHLLNIGISAVIVTLLFALIFKYLPDVEINWKDVAIGAAVTAALFLVGNYAIGLYISKAAVGSAYGPASSIIIVLLWANYSAMIFLLGAEFTQAYAMMYGSQIQPSPDAMLVEKRQ